MNYIFVTIDDIVNIIFKNKPANPCTHSLIISEIPVSECQKFQILMTIFIKGCKKLFGDNITPEQITKEQFELIRRYMFSIGYNTKYNYEQNNSLINIWFEEYKPIVTCKGTIIW